MPTYTYEIEDDGYVTIVPDLRIKTVCNPWPAPVMRSGYWRGLTVEDLHRLQHLEKMANEAHDSLRSVIPTDLGDEDPDESLCEVVNALQEARGRVQAALERLYDREAA